MPERRTSIGGATVHSGSVGPGRPEVVKAKEMAESRLGRLPVEGRLYRLPHRLQDDYELVGGEQLGTGCNGAVVSARGRRTGATYAVKTFSLVGLDVSEKDGLANELGIYLSLDHPHIARLVAVYESETEVCVVMECCEGGELLDRVKEEKVFTEAEAIQAAWQMLLAVNYLHSEGVVHRDLKLENFLYEREGGKILKLIDFGFSTFMQTSTPMRESLGSVHYVAPEVLKRSYLGGSCDMWSLGVIVFFLLVGYMPFDGKSHVQVIRAVLKGKFTVHAPDWAHISDTAQDFVRRLLIAEPSDRMTAEQAIRHPWVAGNSGRGLDAPGRCPFGAASTLAASDVASAFLSFARATRLQRACMRMLAWTLPLEERQSLRDAFLELETSRTGVLRLPQLDQLLEEDAHMFAVDRDAICKAMAELSGDQDWQLRYSDFLAVMMAPRLRKRDRDVVQEVFRLFGAEGLGYLTEEGLWRKLSKEVSGSDLQRALRLLDVDQDEGAYLQDFAAYLYDGPAESPAPAKPGSGVSGSLALIQFGLVCAGS